ncbi:MAG TPA: sulfotransferase domain-containing protein [Dongiaceae bacterium]|nr:sulfotransferase domain-containing protein [Dongiaceae bacterium]
MTLGLSHLVSTGRRAIGGSVMRSFAWTALSPAEDSDLFLLAFPQSGLDWMARLYANACVILAGDRRKVTQFNLDDLVPAEDLRRPAGAPPLPVPGFRCFKSDAPFTRRYRKVIYLVRDPRRVMADRHAALVARGQWRSSLEEMVRHRRHGIRAWVAHAAGWLEHVEAPAFALVRHEDLRARTAFELTRLFDLLGWHLDPAQAAQAVARAAEAGWAPPDPRLGAAACPRPAGPAASGAIPLSAMRLIGETAGPLMFRLGYLAEEAEAPSAERGSPAPLVRLFADKIPG